MIQIFSMYGLHWWIHFREINKIFPELKIDITEFIFVELFFKKVKFNFIIYVFL